MSSLSQNQLVLLLVGVVLVLFSIPAMFGGTSMYGYSGMMGGGFMFIGPLFFIVLIFVVLYGVGGEGGGASRSRESKKEAIQVLERRYARDELTEEEFVERRELL